MHPGGLAGDITTLVTTSASVPRGGGQAYTYQAAMARTMIEYYSNLRLGAVIALGDNFYNNGVASSTDALFTR